MNQLEVEIEIMRAAGLRDEEIAKLAKLKKRADAGEVDDLTIEYKRLMFLKHCRDSGDLTENFKPGDEKRYASIIEQEGSPVKAPNQPSLEHNRLVFQQHLLTTGRINGDVAPDIGPGNTITIRNPADHGELVLPKPR